MGPDTLKDALQCLHGVARSHAVLSRRMERLARREAELQAELARVMAESNSVETELKHYRKSIIGCVALLCGVREVGSVAWTCGTKPIATYVTQGRKFILTACPEENTPNTSERVAERCGLVILDVADQR